MVVGGGGGEGGEEDGKERNKQKPGKHSVGDTILKRFAEMPLVTR